MKKEQLESFNDAVIAIIITLMVLEIKLPELTVANSIVLLRHVFIYALSFFIVAIGWLNLHLLFTNVARVSTKLIWSDLFLLFSLSLIPLPTQAPGENFF